MPRFELEKLSSYDDQSLIDELRRVAALIPEPKFGSSKYDSLGKVHSTTLRTRFGTWRQVLSAAGLENRFDESKDPWTREKIIERLQSVAQRTGRKSVTIRELSEDDGPTSRPVHRLFGTYRKALEAASLSQNRGGIRHTDEECYENLLAVWTAIGRQPNYAELKSAPSKVGPKAYISRWGSWRKALQAFIDRVNQDAPDESRKPEARDELYDKAIRVKRTSRDIPLGLRYTVLVRNRFRCVICGRSPATNLNVNLHVDHLKAWANGGETKLENLRSLCSDCNLGKGSREEEEVNSGTISDGTDASTSSG
jgi:5-methylcytosine-specific restriction endonuclease McrA